MNISIVVAYSENRVIGKDNKLPWGRIKEDLQHFHDITVGHHNLVGRKTHESIGRVLPDRTTLIVTKNRDLKVEGAVVVASVEAGIDYAREHGETELMIIGGQEIYEQALPCADKIYATEIQKGYEGDTYFPKIDERQWQETEKEGRLDLNPPLIYRTLERR